MPQGEAADCLPTEETVDPLEDEGGQVLNLERRRALNPQHQRGGLRRFFAGLPRPVDLERLAVRGNLHSDNVGPARNDLGRGESLRLEHVAQGAGEQVRKRPGKTA